jgi:hypothetical protein
MLIRARSISFSPKMVSAIAANRKTQTRRNATSRLGKLQPFDLMWVGESYSGGVGKDAHLPLKLRAEHPDHVGTWRPGFSLPRAHSRFTLVLTATRLESLHDISEADAIAEGVGSVAEYRDLWEEINGQRTWNINPRVLVLTFVTHHMNINTYLAKMKL